MQAGPGEPRAGLWASLSPQTSQCDLGTSPIHKGLRATQGPEVASASAQLGPGPQPVPLSSASPSWLKV